jgi:LuxR family maltose regulon positive regulatory protein
VSQRPRAAALLEAVDRQGLFVSRLDAEVHTLRLHDLFRNFLEDRLQREHGNEMPLLLRRAAEHEPDLARAIGWLTRAGAWDPAVQALAERGPSLIAAGGGPTVERLLSLFPAAAFERHPDLHFLRGLCAYQRFDFEVLVPSMERAAAGYEVAERNESAAAARIYLASGLRNSGRHAQAAQTFQRLAAEGHDGALGALVAYFCTWEAFAEHRPHAVAPAFAQALERLERLADAELWGQCFLHCFLVGLPQMAPLIERFDRGAMHLTEQRASHLRASVMHARAATALGAGEPGAAHTWLASADEDVRWLGSPRALLTENLLLHLAVDALLGRREACLAAAQRMRADTEESGPANQRTHGSSLVMSEARARWLLGDDDAVRALAAEAQHARNSFEWTYAASERAMIDAMVALIDGRDADAERLLHPAHAGDPEDLLFFRASQVLLMRAEAQRRQGRLDDAARTLRPWLDGVHGGAPVGGALMSGRRTLEPLSRAAWAGRLDVRDAALLLRLLQQLGDGDTAAEAASERPGGLSEREWQVLERIAAGDSNKLIARALDLSPFTVKRHVANIFDKLGLNSRTQAAAWLRDAS